LEEFGVLHSARANSRDSLGRGRPSTAFYLNEEQALYVTMHCRTDRAEAVKVEVVKVFTAWRCGACDRIDQTPVIAKDFDAYGVLPRTLGNYEGTSARPKERR
jgi:hypothetical protein